MRILPSAAAFIIAVSVSVSENCSSRSISDAVEHRITYTNKDTRSEARHGHLYISGNKLPDVFTSVIYRDRLYKFHQRTDMWGMDGYFPAEAEACVQANASGKTVTIEDLDRGWYLGKEALSGTPCSWMQVKWDDNSAFVVPEKAAEMAKVLNLKIILREKVPGIAN